MKESTSGLAMPACSLENFSRPLRRDTITATHMLTLNMIFPSRAFIFQFLQIKRTNYIDGFETLALGSLKCGSTKSGRRGRDCPTLAARQQFEARGASRGPAKMEERSFRKSTLEEDSMELKGNRDTVRQPDQRLQRTLNGDREALADD